MYKSINILFLIAVVILAGAGWLAYSKLSPTNELILHFTQTGQPDYTGSQNDVLMMVIAGGGIVLLNYLVARALRKREGFFPVILSGTSVFISLLLLVAVFVIVVNNQ